MKKKNGSEAQRDLFAREICHIGGSRRNVPEGTHCIRGHFKPSDLYFTPAGSVACRACAKELRLLRKAGQPRPCVNCQTGVVKDHRSFCNACFDVRRTNLRMAESKRVRARTKGGREKASRMAGITGPGTHVCPRCLEEKPLLAFRAAAQRIDGAVRKGATCMQCVAESSWLGRIRKTFGLTRKDYFELLADQGGTCAICLRQSRTRRLSIDHDHKTGRVRGLLCNQCNKEMLGAARDDPAVLRRAIDYLEHPPAEAWRARQFPVAS